MISKKSIMKGAAFTATLFMLLAAGCGGDDNIMVGCFRSADLCATACGRRVSYLNYHPQCAGDITEVVEPMSGCFCILNSAVATGK